jgi:hypothetical protein
MAASEIPQNDEPGAKPLDTFPGSGPDKVLASYWRARAALFTEEAWDNGADSRLSTLMQFLSKVEEWYPHLAKAKSPEHYAQLTSVPDSAIDLSLMRKPGRCYESLIKLNVEFDANATFNQGYYSHLQETRDKVAELVSSTRLVIQGTPYITEPIWQKISDHAQPRQYPFRVFGLCEEAFGWALLLWSSPPEENFWNRKAWVTPNEGPWKPYCKPSPGLWLPLSKLVFSDVIHPEWGFGTNIDFNMLAKATKAQEAKMNSLMALDQRKAEQKQKEQYGSYWR